ncbi:MAG: hypothetical protein CHACPFDD_01568 [Phycisphaerae bacterium]|nr:hypothetical protein [Phycisphaerae bacterium]
MLTVTAAALERLAQKLLGREAGDGFALRFKRAEGRWRLRVGRERPDDATFTHGGRKVLLLDKSASNAMSALTLDVRQTKRGPRLRLSESAVS